MVRKEKKPNRIGQMILSVIIAVVIWLLVAYLNGDATTMTFKRVGVDYIGRTQLAANGLVVSNNYELHDLSVTATGKRDELARSFGKWHAEVDVSGITEPGEYDLESNVTVPNSNLAVKTKNFDTVHVKIEEIVEKEIPVEIWSDDMKGKIIKMDPDRKTVKISGAKSEVDKVSMAYARLDTHRLDMPEQSLMLALVPADSARVPVPPTNETLMLDAGQVTVICTVYDLTTLPVHADLSGAVNPGYGVDISKTRISPASATVGVLPGTDIESVSAEVKRITDEEVECRLIEEDGMYIPESSKTVKVKLAVTRQ